MPKVNNPHPNAVHQHIERLGKSLEVPPGVSEVSEEDFAQFGNILLSVGVELMESLNDTSEKKEPVKTPSKEEKKLESMNDTPDKKADSASKKNEKAEKLEKVDE